MTKKYSRMERNHNWLNFKVIMSIICVATCNTHTAITNQMGQDAAGLPVLSAAHSLVATLDHNLEDSDSQHISDVDVKLSIHETEPALSNSQEATVHKQITRSHSQNSEHNIKNSMKGVFHQNYVIKNRQLIKTSKSKQVPVIHFLLHSRSEDDLFRNNLPLQKVHRMKRLRLRREVSPANIPSNNHVTTSGGTATESNTEKSTMSGGTSSSDVFQDSSKTDEVLNRAIPKLVDAIVNSTVSLSSQSAEVHVTEGLLKPTKGSKSMTTLMNSSVQVTTMPPVSQGTSQSGSTTSITPGVQVVIDGNLNLTEAQEVVPQTSILPKRTSSQQQPTTQVPSQTKPHHTVKTTSSLSKSSKTTVPMTKTNTVLLITNDTAVIGSQVENLHERMSDNDFDPAYQLSNDAYWAFGSLTTVLLLLTACVLFTGLWKKRNNMSNPISDVSCHPSPVRKRKTELKDFLKKKLRHIKTLNLRDSSLTGSVEMNKHYKSRRNGKSNGVYSHRYDTIPLLERTGDDEEDEIIEWEQREKDCSV